MGTGAVPNSRPFVFSDPAPTEIYALSLHDALPILPAQMAMALARSCGGKMLVRIESVAGMTRAAPKPISARVAITASALDRKSTRLNSSHSQISYAVFCLKKKIATALHDARLRPRS